MPKTPTTSRKTRIVAPPPPETAQIIQINFRLDGELRDRIQEYCSDVGIPQSELLRRAVIEYMDARS